MKKKFESAEVRVIKFGDNDIIVTSLSQLEKDALKSLNLEIEKKYGLIVSAGDNGIADSDIKPSQVSLKPGSAQGFISSNSIPAGCYQSA